MSAKITTQYLGHKRVQIHDGISGATILADAPADKGGLGEAFSPTDLATAALSACTMMSIASVAEREGLDLAGMSMESAKAMANAPRRIAEINMTIHLPAGLSEESRKKLERAVKGCPVSNSLHPELKVGHTFIYDV